MKLTIGTVLFLIFVFAFGAWAGAAINFYLMQQEAQSPPFKVVFGQTDSPDEPMGSSIDIMDIPAEDLARPDLNAIHLIKNSSRDTVYKDSRGKHHKVTYKDSPIGWIQFSPTGDYQLGFYYRPQFLSRRSTSDIALAILDVKSREIKEVYRNGSRASNWEWDSGDRVIVYYGCGTACLYAYKIDVETGKTIDEYHIPIKTPPD